MLSSSEFLKQSLGLHLFFTRIMKEHSFFLEIGFTPRDASFTQQADNFRKEFDQILGEAIALSNGVVNPDILRSGEVITPYTLNAENATTYFTGVQIPTNLTQAEAELEGGGVIRDASRLEYYVSILNQRAINATAALIQFKTNILSNVLSCKMFTVNYPLLILHITREAELYLKQLKRLQARKEISLEREAYEQEFFWNRQMAEHAKFIRGLLDPTEEDLISKANSFGNVWRKINPSHKGNTKHQSLGKIVPHGFCK